MPPLVRVLQDAVGGTRRRSPCTWARPARTSWTPRWCCSPGDALAAIDADLDGGGRGGRPAGRRAPRRRRHGPHPDAAGAADDVRAEGGGLAGRAGRRPRCGWPRCVASLPVQYGGAAGTLGRQSAAPASALRTALAAELGLADTAVPVAHRPAPDRRPRRRARRGRRGGRHGRRRRRAAGADRGRPRSARAATPRRLVGDAAQAQPGRGDLRPRLRPPRARPGRHPVRRHGAGARARGRGLARRVADADRPAHHRRLRRRLAGREPRRAAGRTPRAWPPPWPRRATRNWPAPLADALAPALGRGRGARRRGRGRRGRRAATGRPLREVLAGRADVDVPALLGAAPDTGEAGAQVDAVLADHARLTEGTRMSAVAVSYTVDGAGRRARRRPLQLPRRHPARCGTRRCPAWPSGSAWSPTTPAGTGSRRRRPGRTRSTTWSTTCVALLDEVGARAGARRRALAGRDDRDAAGRPRAAARATGWPCCAPRRSPTRRRSSTGRPPSAPGGTAPLAPAVASRWLTPPFAAEHPDLVARLEAMIAGSDDEGYAACCEVVAAVDLRRGPAPGSPRRRW